MDSPDSQTSPQPPITHLATPLTLPYKTLPSTSLNADIYLPIPQPSNPKSPILLFLHGGAWITGSRKDFPAATFHAFLTRNFTIVAIDYRLLPETAFLTGQLLDIQDVEPFLRSTLPKILASEHGRKVDGDKIVVLGVSAGAHLALLTPKIWKTSPMCIISMYGPTDLLSLVPVRRGAFKDFTLPTITRTLLTGALIDPPPTQTPPPKSLAEGLDLRMLLSLAVIGGNVVGEFLVRGLVEGGLPEKGSVDEEMVKGISPYHLAEKIRYPPIFQAMGTEDEAFDISQALSFDQQLKRYGVESKLIILGGKGHSFDMKAEVGDEVHVSVIVPAVDFAETFV